MEKGQTQTTHLKSEDISAGKETMVIIPFLPNKRKTLHAAPGLTKYSPHSPGGWRPGHADRLRRSWPDSYGAGSDWNSRWKRSECPHSQTGLLTRISRENLKLPDSQNQAQTTEGLQRRPGISIVLKQGCQTHFHQGSHQPHSCLQRAECNFRTVYL